MPEQRHTSVLKRVIELLLASVFVIDDLPIGTTWGHGIDVAEFVVESTRATFADQRYSRSTLTGRHFTMRPAAARLDKGVMKRLFGPLILRTLL